MKEARAREQFVAGELAAGRNPAEALRAPSSMPRRSLRQWAEAYRTSRVDLSANAHKALGSHLPRILAAFGDREPETITVADVQGWVATNATRRWVAVPAWLMVEIQATCPLEDRTAERRVFPRFSVDGAEKAMSAACKLAEIPAIRRTICATATRA